MSVISFNTKLFIQLTINRLNNLSYRINHMSGQGGKLLFLVFTRQGQQLNPVKLL